MDQMKTVGLNKEATMLEKLAGYRTYITAAAFGLDAAGAYLGFWPADSLRTVVEEALALVFLRMSVK